MTTTVSGQGLSANFTAAPIAGCSPLVVNFQDLSSGDPTEWRWEFGNGNSSALQHPAATYFTPGTYTVSLTVTNDNGTNTLVRQQYITVYEAPTVNFSANDQSGCFPLNVQFSDFSSAGSGNTNTGWRWDFGDGTTSTLQNPSVSYTSAGSYAVTLRVTNDKGCTNIVTRPGYIQVTPGVTAGFTHSLPTVCSAPATINFTNTSTGPGTLSYIWDFGDGGTSSLPQGPYTFTSNGTYHITLIATSNSGCEDTATTTIVVGEPNTTFEIQGSSCSNNATKFINTSVPAPVSSQWDFGDGTISNQISPVHSYAAPGNYTVKLVNNYNICTDSTSKTITVLPPFSADFTSPDTILCNRPFTSNFQDRSSGVPISWQWNFGDGNTSADQHPSHTYANFGNYTVKLIVANQDGCTDTIVKPNFIKIRETTITILGLPKRGCVPYPVNFKPTITTVGMVTSYQWDFGDGGTSNLPNPSHSYVTQGTYAVKLIITTSSGCTDTLIIPNAIKVGTKPVADFSGTPTLICASTPVHFTDLSVPADEWSWEFGDGTGSTQQNPVQLYSDTGFVHVTLIATNNGCSDTITKNDYIRILPPIAIFGFAANCSNRLQFSFTDKSLAPETWLWNFGDGTTSTLQNPVHNFPAVGSYDVTLTVTNGACTHYVTQTVRPTKLLPDFNTSAVVCRGNAITLAPLNMNQALINSIIWRFGNGEELTTGLAPITYTYSGSGAFSITLAIIDINGCRDSITKNIRVNGPIANFGAANTKGCTGLTTIFSDSSRTDGTNRIVSWQWDFGDGSIQTFTAPPFQHIYNAAGNFNVKLTVTDASGCTSSITKPNLIITSDPLPDFISPDTLSCPNGAVRFINNSVAAEFASYWDFGDGDTSTERSPVHNYADTGFYSVKLIIIDILGCSDTLVKNNYIHIGRPVASFTVSDSISSCIPLEVHFTNTSSFFNSALWDFGDNEGVSTIPDPVHFFASPGIYRVKLLISSPGGCQDSAFSTITLNAISSSITYGPLTGCNPLPVNLNITTNGVIVSYLWDFGDGNIDTTMSPSASHIYSSFGNYLPKVIMEDPAGCLIPVTGLDTIHIIGSNPDFGLSPSLLCDSGYVNFTDSTTSSDPLTGRLWNFGDGTTSTELNPIHYYSSPGLYNATLTTQTQSGCSNDITMPVKVVQSPLINIVGDNEICINDSIRHSGVFVRSDTSAVSWSWTFPNGNNSVLQNPPLQVYTVAGNFVVTVFAINSSGCKDSASQNILVHPLPIVTMPGQITTPVGFTVPIPATYSDGVNTWIWTPATGLSCTDCPEPVAGPKFNTTYRVDFSDINGCRNSATIEVVVICKDANLFIPNTFTPNDDGSNDKFYPRGRGLYSIKVLRIFNRWGEIVFENRNFQPNDASKGWDGKYKGREPHPDVYVYQVEVFCDNGEIIKLEGNVALIL